MFFQAAAWMQCSVIQQSTASTFQTHANAHSWWTAFSVEGCTFTVQEKIKLIVAKDRIMTSVIMFWGSQISQNIMNCSAVTSLQTMALSLKLNFPKHISSSHQSNNTPPSTQACAFLNAGWIWPTFSGYGKTFFGATILMCYWLMRCIFTHGTDMLNCRPISVTRCVTFEHQGYSLELTPAETLG